MGKLKLRSFFLPQLSRRELANFFYKILESKNFRLWGLCYLLQNYSAVVLLEKTKQNEGNYVSIKLYLWALILEFLKILSDHE